MSTALSSLRQLVEDYRLWHLRLEDEGGRWVLGKVIEKLAQLIEPEDPPVEGSTRVIPALSLLGLAAKWRLRLMSIQDAGAWAALEKATAELEQLIQEHAPEAPTDAR